MEYDLAIIGAGPGGYVAALRAARLGAKVALIEKDEVGGTCLNRGCIPTKALVASAHGVLTCQRFHISPPSMGGDEGEGDHPLPHPPPSRGRELSDAQSRKDQIVTELRNGVGQLLKAAGIELIKGEAKFVEANKIEVNGSPLDAKKILIATGSAWWVPPGITLDGKSVVSSDEALAWTEVPESLLIVGGGAIGCEFASIFAAFGSKVTIVEAMPSILPTVERSISRLLVKSFKDRGIEICTETTVESTEVKGNKVAVKLIPPPSLALSEACPESRRRVEGTGGGVRESEKLFDRVLVCVGRRPNPPIPPLKKGGIQGEPPFGKGGQGGFKLTDHGAIRVNEKFETSVPNVYAIGDVIGNWMLAHVASAEGISCVEQMMGKGEPVNYSAIPSPIFTIPEMASVGLTAEELQTKKIPFRTGRFPYAANGKARCDGETEGMAVVHVDDKGIILGAHFFGKDATMLAAEATLAVRNTLTAHDVGATIHAHPTISEIFAEAALDAVGEAIHKVHRK